MIESKSASEIQKGESLILGQVPYKITDVITCEDGKIQFHLSRFNIRSSLVAKPTDDLTVLL